MVWGLSCSVTRRTLPHGSSQLAWPYNQPGTTGVLDANPDAHVTLPGLLTLILVFTAGWLQGTTADVESL